MIKIDPQTVTLQILLEGPATVDQLATKLRERSFSLARTSAQVALMVLEERGLVVVSAPVSERLGRPPRVFELTRKGRKVAEDDRARKSASTPRAFFSRSRSMSAR